MPMAVLSGMGPGIGAVSARIIRTVHDLVVLRRVHPDNPADFEGPLPDDVWSQVPHLPHILGL